MFNSTKQQNFGLDKIKSINFADKKFSVVENFVGKVENADYQHFLFFPLGFSNAFFFFMDIKSQDVVEKN